MRRTPERQRALQVVEEPFLELAAGGRIADDANLVTRRDLCLGQIADVAEDSPDGRPEAMHYAQPLVTVVSPA